MIQLPKGSSLLVSFLTLPGSLFCLFDFKKCKKERLLKWNNLPTALLAHWHKNKTTTTTTTNGSDIAVSNHQDSKPLANGYGRPLPASINCVLSCPLTLHPAAAPALLDARLSLPSLSIINRQLFQRQPPK